MLIKPVVILIVKTLLFCKKRESIFFDLQTILSKDEINIKYTLILVIKTQFKFNTVIVTRIVNSVEYKINDFLLIVFELERSVGTISEKGEAKSLSQF